MSTKKIEYINATPAAGKTREARRIIEEHLRSDKRSIVVYAAPRHLLLDEVFKMLRDTIDDEVLEDKLFYVDGKNVVAQYAYAMDMISKEDARRALEPESFERITKGGFTVILCTHECITRAPRATTKQSSKGLVIFDEARQCVLEDIELKVSKSELNDIIGLFDLVKQCSVTEEVLVKKVAHKAALYSLTGAGFPSTQKLLAHFKAKETKDLPKSIRSLLRMRKTCEGNRADILIEILEPKDKSARTAYLIGVARPSSLFEGYGRVLIMSAYFEYSQMYHLLKNAHVGHQLGQNMIELVEAKTSTNFAIRSAKITENSLKNIRIGALLGGTTKRLTATMLSTGLIVPIELQELVRQKLADGKRMPKKADFQAAAFSTNIMALGKRGNELLQKAANPPVLQLRRIAWEILSALKVDSALCFVNAFGSGASGGKFKVGSLTTCPADLIHNMPTSLWNEAYERERKFMTADMTKHMVDTANFFTVPRSTSVLGLNKYDDYNAFVHIAALNPKPSVARVLKRIMPGYEPDLDYAVSNIIQTMYRTSLRKPHSKELVHCLVISEWQIEKIERVCFAGRKLQRINYVPTHCAVDYQAFDKKQKSEAGKIGGKIGGTNKRKYSPETAKELNRIKASLRTARLAKNPKPDTIRKWEKALEKLSKNYRKKGFQNDFHFK